MTLCDVIGHNVVSPENASEALKEARRCAVASRVRLSGHARLRMSERGLHMQDVLHALVNATRCEAGKPGKWELFGPSLDGDELTVIAVLDAGLLVVTVFGGD